MPPSSDADAGGNEENIPPPALVGRYNTVTRQLKKPLQQTRVPWHHRRQKKRAAVPPPSNLVPKPISPKVVLRRAKKVAMNEATKKAINSLWDLAKDLEADPQFDRTATWWYKYILQIARKDQGKRRVNLWNAFLHKEVRERNDELPGEERLTAPQHMETLREIWSGMSKEERIEATKDAVGDVEAMREMRENAVHNVVISAFHDVRANVSSIEQQISTMHNRTGAEALMLVVRADDSQLNHPHAFVTSQKIVDFFQGAYGIDVSQLGSQLESYCLSGVEGLRTNQRDSLVKLCTRTADLIKAKLDAAVHPVNVGRMNYVSFDTAITDRYGVICEGWPLQTFCSPCAIKSRLSVELLHAAWTNGTARFRRLTPEELRARQERQAEELRRAAVEAAAAQTSSVAVNPGAASSLDARAESVPIDPALLMPIPIDPTLLPTSTPSALATAGHVASESASGPPQAAQQVFNITTSTLVPVRTRKVRSDKGLTRAPYKKKAKATATTVSVAS